MRDFLVCRCCLWACCWISFSSFSNTVVRWSIGRILDFLLICFHGGHIVHCCPAGDRTQARCCSSCWCFSPNSSSAFSTRCTLTWERGTSCPPLPAKLSERCWLRGDGLESLCKHVHTHTHRNTHTLFKVQLYGMWAQASRRASVIVLMAVQSTQNDGPDLLMTTRNTFTLINKHAHTILIRATEK